MNRQTALIIILVISLGLNLLIAGFFIGRVVSGGKAGPHPGWMMHSLSEETRRMMASSMRQNREETQAMRHALRTAQRELHEVIGAESFDRDATVRALTEVREISTRYQHAMHEQMVDTLAMLEPDDRLKVYRFLTERRPDSRRGPPAHHP